MKLKYNVCALIVGGLLMSCGNSKDIQLSMPGIVSGKLTVISLTSSKILLQKNVDGPDVSIGVIETGIGVEPVEIKIEHAVYEDFESTRIEFSEDEFFSTIVGSDYKQTTLNINPMTTLATCHFKNTFSPDEDINNKIIVEHRLIKDQFLVNGLVEDVPVMDFSNIQTLDDASIYGILLGGFDVLAKEQHISASSLVRFLCDDLSYDGIFDSVDAEGNIQKRLAGYDEQVMKYKFASAIYRFGQSNLKFFNDLPMNALASQVSLSAMPQLFSPLIVNYSFDH